MNNVLVDDNNNLLIALDSTAIICYISELTNNTDFLDLNYTSTCLINQSKQEIHHKALTKLNLINNSNNIIICQAVIDEMKPILENLAGPNEIERANILYSRSRIIPNYPLSERISSLKLTKRIQDRTKIIFGTADYFNAIIFTSNKGFINSVCNTQKIDLKYIFHEPRSLVETASVFK